jgi:sugar O-acyltransferase (sialic acid O-acetyltransferase NeuD family)
VTRVVGLGAGGHAAVVVDILRLGGHDIVGLLDPDRNLADARVEGVLVLGGDESLAGMRDRGVRAFFVGVGSTGNAAARRRLFALGRDAGLEPLTAVHPAAVVADSATLGAGVTVMAGAIINPRVRLGENVIVNTGAIVEHDCVVGNHCHVAPGAVLGGGVRMAEAAHVGIGAVVREQCRIGPGAVVGAGAVVLTDVPASVTVVGVPARVLSRT